MDDERASSRTPYAPRVLIAVLLAASLPACQAEDETTSESTTTLPAPQSSSSIADTPTRARSADGRWISWREHIIDDEAVGGVAIRGGDGLESPPSATSPIRPILRPW